jgi:mono/diheme cytochrome c family protein
MLRNPFREISQQMMSPGRPVFCGLLLTLGSMAMTKHSAAEADRAALPPAATRKVDFAMDLQPLFADRCFDCHGEKKQESGLRLDGREFALKGGDHGPALVPGKSAESLVVQVLAGVHADIAQMPRKKDKLTAEQIGLVRAWIDQGAEWQGGATAGYGAGTNHWAFKAPIRPTPPAPKSKRWVRNQIDAFILARLEKESLKPSPEADKITLLRRLSLDLIGLPPSPEEVDAFLADKSPQAYVKQVERLLASPHYGERWARHWLDAARYADSDGFEKDKPRFIWPYRDWVINALNRDLPYNEFIIAQLAGDQLRHATQDQIVATGFLRNSMINEEGGVDPEQFRMEAMFDRMDAIGKSVLGLTIQCAQCHNHKFDPISQEEYYRLFAFLNNDHESQRVVYSTEAQMLVANLTREMQDLEAGLRHTTPDWEQRMAKWGEEVKSNQPEWTVLRPWVEEITTGGQRYLPQPDGSFLAQGYAPTKHGVHLWATNDSQNVSAFRIELLTDPNLPANGPGRSIKGTCALTEFTVEAIEVQNPSNKVSVTFTNVTADFEQLESPLEAIFDDRSNKKRVVGPVKFANDNDEHTAWGMDAGPGRRNQDRKAVFPCATNVGFAGGTIWHIRVIQRHGGWNSDDNMNNNLGRFRISLTTNTGPVVADPLPSRVRDILAIPREQRTPAQVSTLLSHWRTTVPEFKETNGKIEKLWAQWPEGSTSLTLATRAEPRETHMLKRGDFLKPGKAVTFGVPAFLHPLPPGADGSRLTFANWLVDKKSPTTARALVNRVWQTYFGTGLVESPEDFGTRCELPSHPELLDWLACEFMQPTSDVDPSNRSSAKPEHVSTLQRSNASTPWSLKHLHRLIVNSATYRQSSHVTPQLYAKDPYNRLLARAPRLRVEGEIVRDIALAASGLLNADIGGRSVFPPAPDFLFQPPASYGPKTWKEDTGPERYRRGLYIFKFRSVPYPMLQTFDAPNGDFSCVRRQRSNTPLQALVSLNEPVFMECAQALARKTLAEGGKTDAERINFAFCRTLSRTPTDRERQELLSLLEKQEQHIAQGWVNPFELATGRNEKPDKLPDGVTPTHLAAYTVVSRVLLNLDETITKE